MEIGSILSLIPVVIMTGGVILGALFGFRRGLVSSAVRLGTIIVSAIIAFFVARYAGDALGNFLHSQGALDQVISGILGDSGDLLADILAGIIDLVIPLPIYIIIVPVLFLPIFLLLKWLTYIIYAIVAKVLRLKKLGGSFLVRKLGGIAVGALQGFVVAILCIMPFAGLSSVAQEAKTVIADQQTGELPDGIDEVYETVLDNLDASPVISITNTMGGRALYGALTTTELQGENCDLSNGIIHLVEIVSDASVLVEMDWTAPHLHKEEIRVFIDETGNDKYVSVILAKVFNSVGEIASEDMSVFLPEAEGPLNSIMNSFFGIFKSVTPASVHDDMNTLFDALFVLGENDVIEGLQSGDKDALLNVMTKELDDGTLVIDAVIDILSSNPHTITVIESITTLSLTIMCEQMGLDEDATLIYQNLKNEVNNILSINKDEYANEDEYKSAVSEQLDIALKNNSIELEDEVIDGMTDYIAENYSDTSDISDADVQKALLSYYGSYVNAGSQN